MNIDNVVQLNINDTYMFDNIVINDNLYILGPRRLNIKADTIQINWTPRSPFEGFTISPEVCIGLPIVMLKRKLLIIEGKLKWLFPLIHQWNSNSLIENTKSNLN